VGSEDGISSSKDLRKVAPKARPKVRHLGSARPCSARGATVRCLQWLRMELHIFHGHSSFEWTA
jgi:hypothetical protein